MESQRQSGLGISAATVGMNGEKSVSKKLSQRTKPIKRCTQIKLHRDKLEIEQWGSIKEYMQSIAQMDYAILLISEAYR